MIIILEKITVIEFVELVASTSRYITTTKRVHPISKTSVNDQTYICNVYLLLSLTYIGQVVTLDSIDCGNYVE